VRIGILKNVSGNIEALKDADQQFDQMGVDRKVCLGHIAGLYPWVDDCVSFLNCHGYSAVQSLTDEGLVGYCQGNYDFLGWSTLHLVSALKFSARFVSQSSLDFLSSLPGRRVLNDIAFESRAPVNQGYIFDPEHVSAVFASCPQRVVFHAAHLDPCLWGEDLHRVALASGCNQVPSRGRLLVSTGGAGSIYNGSANTREPAAVVFDESESTVFLLRPRCNLPAIIERLRRAKYPQDTLDFISQREYEAWRPRDSNESED
jgi:hypothetical protein